MNDLSWFIYIVGFLGSLKAFILFLGVAFIVFACFRTINRAIDCDSPAWQRCSSKNLTIGVCFILLSTFIPLERTMYLILGSELGEEVAKSDTAKKVMSVIDKKLNEYLKESLPE